MPTCGEILYDEFCLRTSSVLNHKSSISGLPNVDHVRLNVSIRFFWLLPHKLNEMTSNPANFKFTGWSRSYQKVKNIFRKLKLISKIKLMKH